MITLKTMTYEVTGRIARITLNRPQPGNGITMDMPQELAACVERANIDPAVHVIALAGNGSGFCGGYDLVESAEGMATSDASPLAPHRLFTGPDGANAEPHAEYRMGPDDGLRDDES